MIARYWLFSFLLVGLSTDLFSQRYDFGLGSVYGSEINSPGLNTRYYVNSNDHRFCFGPEFTIFYPHEEAYGALTKTKKLWEFNLNAHINFMLIGNLGFYPLIGLNHSRESEELSQARGENGFLVKNEWGMNLGIGLHYDLPKHYILFCEYDYLLSPLGQHTVMLGALVGFGQIKSNDDSEPVFMHH